MPAILLPSLGTATDEATVLHWLKAEGEAVGAGESLVEVALEKTVHVLTAGQPGGLSRILAPAGAIVPAGEPLGWIGAPGAEDMPPGLRCRLVGWEEEVAPPPDNLAELLEPRPEAVAGGEGEAESHPLETFAARHRTFLRGQLRGVTARRMAKSWVDAPKVDLFAEVDLSRVEAHRAALKEQGQEAPSYNIYIAHAVVKAFADLPQFNFQSIGGKAAPLDGIHVGMAVALGDNLVTVSMKNLGGVDLMEIQKRFKALIRKALRVSLTREDLYGSSLTITNLGEFDVTAFTAIINPPEAFILAIGKVEPRVVAREGEVAIATMCTFCLSFDHRAVDGAPASRLLQRIKQHMEGEPEPR